MKVILLEKIPKVGNKFDIVEVAPGFARNSLIPNGKAEIATESAISKSELKRSLHLEKLELAEKELAKKLAEIKSLEIKIVEKANEKGSLFAGLRKEELAVKISEQSGIALKPEHIHISKPIKEVGEYKVEIGVQDKKAICKVIVEAAA